MAEKNVESAPNKGSTAKSMDQSAERGERRQRGASGAMERRPSPAMGGAFGLSPFSLVRRMMEDMDRMVEGFSGPSARFWRELWSPPIETFERDGRFVLRAELPGLSAEDVRLEVQDDALVLQGERKSELEAEEQGAFRSERTYGRFSRTIPLPEGAEGEKAQAKFENGILEVSIPLRDAGSRHRRIEIRSGSGGSGSVH